MICGGVWIRWWFSSFIFLPVRLFTRTTSLFSSLLSHNMLNQVVLPLTFHRKTQNRPRSTPKITPYTFLPWGKLGGFYSFSCWLFLRSVSRFGAPGEVVPLPPSMCRTPKNHRPGVLCWTAVFFFLFFLVGGVG